MLECFLFVYGGNCYIAAVAYLAGEDVVDYVISYYVDVVLDYGCVSVFIPVRHILSGKKAANYLDPLWDM